MRNKMAAFGRFTGKAALGALRTVGEACGLAMALHMAVVFTVTWYWLVSSIWAALE